MNGILKKSVILSLLGHLTVFSFFSFSFGRYLPEANYSKVVFQGSVLDNFDLGLPDKGAGRPNRGKAGLKALTDKFNIDDLCSRAKDNNFSFGGYLKPAGFMPIILQKQVFAQKFIAGFKNRQAPAVMFYPRLPQYFNIYFKDRQFVYVELMFKITPMPNSNSISIKRKVSSGNLEADLLCMRYIKHYLFLRQSMFVPGKWQAVKIDLSAKDTHQDD